MRRHAKHSFVTLCDNSKKCQTVSNVGVQLLENHMIQDFLLKSGLSTFYGGISKGDHGQKNHAELI